MAATVTRTGSDLTNANTIFYTVILSQGQTGGSADWFDIRANGTGATPTVTSVRAVDASNTVYRVAVSTVGFNGTFHLGLDIPYFDNGHRYRFSAAGDDPRIASRQIGDLNNDGRPDLVVATNDTNGERGAVYIFLNDGSGRFSSTPSQTLNDDDWDITNVILGNFNRDKFLDLAIGNSHADEVWIDLNNGNGTFNHTDDNTPDVGNIKNIVSADFNGDGIADIATLNLKHPFFQLEDDNISILLGRGNGTFGSEKTVDIDIDAAFGLQVGYINADDRPDLIFRDASGVGREILLGKGDPDKDGDADFTRQSLGNIGGTVIASGSDGRLNLLTVENNILFVASYSGNAFGNPTLIPLSRPTANGNANAVAADINLDGTPDIVVNNNDGTMSILIGLGDNRFAPEQVVSAGTVGVGGAAADFDGDGRSDLVRTVGGSQIDIFYNQHEFAAGPSTTIDHVPPSLAITSGGGVTDQFTRNISGVASGGDAGAMVYIADGNRVIGSATLDGAGRFSATVTFTSADVGAHSITASTSDLAGNRGVSPPVSLRIDLTAPVVTVTSAGGPTNQATQYVQGTVDAGNEGTIVMIREGDAVLGTTVVRADGSWSARVELAGEGVHALTAADTDQLGRTGSDTLSYTLDTVQPTITGFIATDPLQSPGTSVHYRLTFSEAVRPLDAADFTLITTGGVTGAGIASIVRSADGASFDVTVDPGSGNGTIRLALDGEEVRDLAGNGLAATHFAAPVTVAKGSSDPIYFSTGDFNGDGFLDIASVGRSGGGVSIAFGNAQGGFGAPGAVSGISGANAVIAADLDGDGQLDLLVPSDLRLSAWKGAGNGTFSLYGSVSLFSAESIQIADLNGDNRTDVVVSSALGMAAVLQQADGSVEIETIFALGVNDFALGDVDGDGRQDLITLGSLFNNRTVSVRLGEGDGTFGNAIDRTLDFAATHIATGDLDGDGRADAVVGDDDGNVAALFVDALANLTVKAIGGVGEDIGSIVIADYDVDGDADVLISYTRDASLSLIAGHGDGSFDAPVSLAVPSATSAVQVVDANRDGNIDILTLDTVGDGIAIRAGVADALSGPTYTVLHPPVGSPLVDRDGTVSNSGPGNQTLRGTPAAETFFFDSAAGPTGRDRIEHFGSNDVLVLTTKLPDSNNDGIVTFGGNGLLNIAGSAVNRNLIDMGGVDPRTGLRYLGEAGEGFHTYAAAAVRPRYVKEGQVFRDDTLSGGAVDNKRDLFFVDTALHADLGDDSILNFGARDVLITTSRLDDPDDDGSVLFGPAGLAFADGGSLTVSGIGGAALDALDLAGTTVHGDVTYYLYGTPGAVNLNLTLVYL